jgi:hypothetical protein
MNKREKVLLAAVCVTAVVGLWVTLDRPSPPVAKVPQAEDGSKAVSLLRTIKDTDLSATDVALLSAIGNTWRVSAFYDKPLGGREVTRQTTLPRYTGYVELGSGKLAVVDGMEYQAGDTLDGGGYKVISIAPDQVVLESLANGQRLTIPYEGEQAQGS